MIVLYYTMTNLILQAGEKPGFLNTILNLLEFEGLLFLKVITPKTFQ